MNVNKQTVVWGLAGVAGAYVLGKFLVKDAAGEIGQAVDTNFNPTRDTNLANRAAQGVWDVFTDGQGTIGTDVYDGVQRLKGWWSDIIGADEAEAIARDNPTRIGDAGAPEGSVHPNSWSRQTPGPSGRAPVTEEQFRNQRVL